MEITIKEVLTKSDMNDFIDLPYRLYKNHPYYVPPLKFDEKNVHSKKNPALDYCVAKYWLAYKGNKVVGRVCAILNKAYIEKWGNKYLRFGWIDFEDDINIARALTQQVEAWAKELGMTAVHGPLGFTDLDPEGMLVDGFEELGTIATIYNYPYYPKHLEALGYIKDVDWVQHKLFLPPKVNEKVERIAKTVMQRYQLTIAPTKSAKDVARYGKEIFNLLNEAYAHLYGVVELTNKQVDSYIKQYLGFVRPEYLPLILDKNGKLICFGITMPSLSKATQANGGKLLPFGFIDVLKAIKGKNDTVDLYLIAVSKEYQGKGINAILMWELTRQYALNGVKYAEINQQLEDNNKVQAMWENYDSIQHKRRRCYIKLVNG